MTREQEFGCGPDGKCPQKPDFSWTHGCFPRPGIQFSDVDNDAGRMIGEVEINWHFLRVETKKDSVWPGNFRRGQQIADVRKSSLPGWTCIIQIMLPEGSQVWRIWSACYDSGWRKLTLEQARAWLTKWGQVSDKTDPHDRSRDWWKGMIGEPTDAPPSWDLNEDEIRRENWSPQAQKTWGIRYGR